jgi:hypothetical protein
VNWRKILETKTAAKLDRPNFSWNNITGKCTKMPQNTPSDKNTKRLKSIPNGPKINQYFSLKGHPKLTHWYLYLVC